MKKIAALLLCFAMMFNFFALLAISHTSAADTSSSFLSIVEDEEIGKINSCIYDASSKKIEINGTISHDIMVTHGGYRIAVYAIPFGKTFSDIMNNAELEPLASSAISVKFSFSISVDSVSERFSMYAVVIYNEEGEIKTVGRPKCPSARSSYSFTAGDKNYYKGVSSSLVSVSSDTGASTSIIPVYLDKLLNNSSKGYLYSLDGSYIYFDKEYVERLDAQIKSLAATGCRVYLQFIQAYTALNGVTVLAQQSADEYGIPDMSIDKTVSLISGFTDFLCERYKSNRIGISGIVLGSRADELYDGAEDGFLQYALNYTRYMMIVGNIARSIIPLVDIVLPVSDCNSYDKKTDNKLPVSNPSSLLDAVCANLDDFFVDEFVFSAMLETSKTPYGITTETLESGDFSTDGYDGVNADNIYLFSDYLDILKHEYDSSPKSFMFLWSVPKSVNGNVLACAYAYSYFKLLPYAKISSFTISFEENEKSGDFTQYPEIANIMKYIDTSDGFEVTKPQLKLLDAANWYSIVDMYSGKLDIKRILNIAPQALPANAIGSYAYYDFSYYADVSAWFAGNDCDSLKIDYSDISGRALKAHFKANLNSPSEFSELYCSYEYPENFVYTPHMVLDFSIKNDNEIKNALYEVKVLFGSGKNVTEVSEIFSPYEKVSLSFNISDFNGVSMADYIKIGIRCITGDNGGYSLSLSSISGYSTEYSSDELSVLISDERLRIRDMIEKNDDGESQSINTVMVIAGVIVVIAVIGIGVFMCFRTEEE